MRYQYILADQIDTIEENHLSAKKFNAFVEELKDINVGYEYSIFLYGEYLDFLINRNNYTTINFFITNKKIVELEKLYNFLNDFHQLCKKYNIIYNMFYGVNLIDENINKNSSNFGIFNILKTKYITLYKNIIPNAWSDNDLTNIVNSKLFEGVIDSGMMKKISGFKGQTRKTFPTPIKIV